MKVYSTKTLSNGIGLSIIEVDNPIAVLHFTHRFQVVLIVNNKRIMPKNKNKFLEFDENNYIYTLKSDKTSENVQVNEVLFYELLICDELLLECELTVDELCLQDTEELFNSLHELYYF
jgi:hypothetical protein